MLLLAMHIYIYCWYGLAYAYANFINCACISSRPFVLFFYRLALCKICVNDLYNNHYIRHGFDKPKNRLLLIYFLIKIQHIFLSPIEWFYTFNFISCFSEHCIDRGENILVYIIYKWMNHGNSVSQFESVNLSKVQYERLYINISGESG